MSSHSEFGERTPGLEVAKVFADQIRSRNVLITGVNPKGIGGSTTIAIASQQPALLILSSRTREKMESIAKSIQESYLDVKVEIVELDFFSQKKIREAVAETKNLTHSLDILINNAGAVVSSRKKTAEGLEFQFGTTHIGPFLFTNLLMPLLLKAAEKATPGSTRIVSLSSAGHRLSPLRFSDYNFEGHQIPPEEDHYKCLTPAFAKTTEDGYNGIVAYAQSKTANILFTVYLQKYLTSRGIVTYVLHPGSIETELGRGQDEEKNAALKTVSLSWKTLDEGLSTTLVAALDPALRDVKGLYLRDCQIEEPAPFARDPGLVDKLWHLSEELIGEGFNLDP